MRILIGTDTYYPDINGASYFTQRFAEGMQRRGHTVHVIYPSRTMTATLLEHHGIPLHGIPAFPVPFQETLRAALLPLAYQSVVRAVDQIDPDIVHVQGHFPIARTLIHLARRRGLPLIATNHFMPDNLAVHLHLPRLVEQAFNAVAWRDFARVFNRVPVITTPTSIAADLIAAKGVTRPVLPISCGLDLSKFSPRADGAALRRKYGIPERSTCLFVGRLDKEKHIDELIQALAVVRQTVDAQLVIVGGGKQQHALQHLAAELQVADAVSFMGVLSDDELPNAYRLCDLFCHAGTAELQSLVTMEAMATGKPVIAANAVALPLLVQDGFNGYTFPPGDVQQLAERIVEVLTDPDRQRVMGQHSLERIATHDLSMSLHEYEEAYQTAVGQRPVAMQVQVRG